MSRLLLESIQIRIEPWPLIGDAIINSEGWLNKAGHVMEASVVWTIVDRRSNLVDYVS